MSQPQRNQLCPRCDLPAPFTQHQTIFSCISALLIERKVREARIAELETNELSLKKQLREREWQEATR